MGLKNGDVTMDARDVTPAELLAWYDTVYRGRIVALSEIERVLDYLDPRGFEWLSRVMIDIELRDVSRDRLLLNLGATIRLKPSLAGPYYTESVRSVVHGNLGVYRDTKLVTGTSEAKEDIVRLTPSLSVIVAVIHQAWLRSGGKGQISEEFRVTDIEWTDLASRIRHACFYTVSQSISLSAYRDSRIHYVTAEIYALVTSDGSDISGVVPVDRPNLFRANIEYARGDKISQRQDRLVPREGYDDVPDNFLYNQPGTEDDVMFLASALVRYYCQNEGRDKVIPKMYLYPLLRPPTYPYATGLQDSRAGTVTHTSGFLWPILREAIYDGNLRYDYSRPEPVVYDYRTVAENLSRYLTSSAYDALFKFLDRVGMVPDLRSYMRGEMPAVDEPINIYTRSNKPKVTERITLPPYEGRLPILHIPTLEEYNTLLEAFEGYFERETEREAMREKMRSLNRRVLDQSARD
jgi:hypothetical protein